MMPLTTGVSLASLPAIPVPFITASGEEWKWNSFPDIALLNLSHPRGEWVFLQHAVQSMSGIVFEEVVNG